MYRQNSDYYIPRGTPKHLAKFIRHRRYADGKLSRITVPYYDNMLIVEEPVDYGSLFASLKKNYDDEKNQLNTVIADLLKRLNSNDDVSHKVQILYAAIKKYDAVTELTPEVLNDFLEKIEVGRYKNSDKKIPFAEREYEISVFFWGVGIINFLENLLP